MQEVLDALRPGMITVRNAKLVKISTPFSKAGLLWEEFQRRSELPFAVWQLSTFTMNPTITPHMAAAERLESEEKYQREYLAQFTDAIDAWMTPEILEPCIVRERRVLPRMENVTYFAAIDPASRKNDYALVILHKDRDQNIIVDRVEFWTGTKTAPLPFEKILEQIKEILDCYKTNSVTGDQFYCDAIGQHLLGLGVIYNVEVFGPQTRATTFTGLEHLMVQGKIQILNDPDLLRQLRSLRVEKTPRGQIDIRPSSGNDDIAVALALAANDAITQKPSLTIDLIPFDPRPSAASLGLIPGNCYVESACGNHPKCIDVDECLSFLDLRLVQIAG